MHHNTESEQPTVNQVLYRKNAHQSQAQLLKSFYNYRTCRNRESLIILTKTYSFLLSNKWKLKRIGFIFICFTFLLLTTAKTTDLLHSPLLRIISNIYVMFPIMFWFFLWSLWNNEIESFNDKLLHAVNVIFLDFVNFHNWMSFYFIFCFDRQYNIQFSVEE